MKQPIIGVVPLWDEKLDSIWMVPGYPKGSPLYKLAGKESLEVNSSHHQGINRLAKGLEIMALADDGLVEAVYMPERPDVWAVQWHPEHSLKDEMSRKIFSAFVENI